MRPEVSACYSYCQATTILYDGVDTTAFVDAAVNARQRTRAVSQNVKRRL